MQSGPMIRAALAMLFPPNTVVEVRMLNTGRGTISGYFDDREKLAACAERYSGRAPAVYVTLNECRPDLLARAHNRVREFARETTSDDQILRRRWLPLDFDPVRPAGISATNAEHDAALARAIDCKDWLKSCGWPEPILADSGNGGHLLYPLDLPNEPAARDLLSRVLQALAFRFDDEGVKVDQTTYNASRIWKLYGTLACKGDDMPDRPHRLAQVLEGDERREPVTVDQLGDVAKLLPTEPKRESRPGLGEPFDLDRWMADRGLNLEAASWQGGRKWVFGECPWNADHTDRSAYLVQFPSGAIAAGCHHNGCAQNHWHELRDRLEPGWRDRLAKNGAEPVQSSPPNQAGAFVVNVVPSLANRAEEPPGEVAAEAFYGLPGALVEAIEPHTESHSAAILASFIVGAGVLVGRGPFIYRDGARHCVNEFACLVGPSSMGRKGTATRRTDEALRAVDTQYCKQNNSMTYEAHAREAAVSLWPRRQVSGLGSGEALVAATAEADEDLDAHRVERRRLVFEEEMARALTVMNRDGSILSEILRNAWDGAVLSNRVKGRVLQADSAHIGILGHITEDELRVRLGATEMFNGFANRFLWICTRRSKSLPFGGGRAPLAPIISTLHAVLDYARQEREIEFDDQTKQMWDQGGLYNRLIARPPGLLGSVTGRAEVHVTRLALFYAVMDAASAITARHLLAALAVWDYSEQSCAYLFGRSTGDEYADMIEELLAEVYPGGLTRTELRDKFRRNAPAGRIPKALGLLQRAGKVECRHIPQEKGRPTEIWSAVGDAHRLRQNDINDKSPLEWARELTTKTTETT